jgi:hypothetical protein
MSRRPSWMCCQNVEIVIGWWTENASVLVALKKHGEVGLFSHI